ncbi:hypothetical protein BSR28_01790 [Boudabousia liubingyangii]|uniref:PD-(D/E)XK motif protein n=1 Tax=Boudabousia liubingyangii TaxID=1921764 RepID=UPI00093E5847|nr:PD-(D/E)XK motif protein [Boudabousia liubingyangii]OKL48457.1 hypothetical protein BSR28_01790 [Boudabousia liubingyangii]
MKTEGNQSASLASMSPWDTLGDAENKTEIKTHMISKERNPKRIACYWIKDYERKVGIKVEYKDEKRDLKIPSFTQLKIVNDEVRGILYILLNNNDVRDVFAELCYSLCGILQDAEEKDYLALTISILYKWRRLFEEKNSALSIEKQKGLIGEISFIEQGIKQGIAAYSLIDGWVGGTGDHQDFVFGSTLVEVKTKRGGAYQKVRISSEHQLEKSNQERLFLVVFSVVKDEINGKTLNEIIEHLFGMIGIHERIAFENKLADYGFFLEEKHKEKWKINENQVFEVEDQFPAITPRSIPPEIRAVAYDLELGGLKNFETNMMELANILRNENA